MDMGMDADTDVEAENNRDRDMDIITPSLSLYQNNFEIGIRREFHNCVAV